MSDTHDGNPNEIIEREFAPTGGVMSSLARSELDVQISTAKAFPRSIKKFMDDATTMATLDVDIAKGCMYSVPRDGKMIPGPSVRLAEIVASAWGNIHAATRIIGEDRRFITAQSVVWDLERNLRLGFEVRRRITKKDGSTFGDDGIMNTANSAMSIAFRNAVFRIVPNALIKQVYRKCVDVAVGDAKTLSARRSDMVAHFAKLGIKADRVFAAVDAKSEIDIDLERMGTLIGLANAIRDGETSIDDAFPDPTGAEDAAKKKDAANTGGKLPEGAPAGTTGDKSQDLAAQLKAKREAAGIATETTTTPGPTTVAADAKKPAPSKPKPDAKAPTTLPGLTDPPDTE